MGGGNIIDGKELERIILKCKEDSRKTNQFL